MDFQYFQKISSNAEFDEIKVIGKDIQKDDQNYHIIGMTLKEKKVTLHVLEAPGYLEKEFEELLEEENLEESILEERILENRLPRNSMKRSMERDNQQSLFLHVREFRCGEKNYEVAGGQSGAFKECDYLEAYMLFVKMQQAGWKVSEESPFYHLLWDVLAVTNIELRDEFESLPEWEENIEIVYDSNFQQYPVEKPVLLECGKTTDIAFELEDGKQAMCYINKVELHDVWAGQDERFADPVYRERVLQHMSEEEFEKMKEDFYRILEEHCPKGKCFLAIEYECSEENISVNFYDKEYLDTIPQPSSGSCSSMMMRNKPEKEIGIHGLKLRGEMIQKPLEKDVKGLEAELFSYYTMVEKKSCKLSELVFQPGPKIPERVLTEEEKESLVARYNLIKPKR